MAKNREPENPVEPESEYEESSDEGIESEPEPVEDTNSKPPPPAPKQKVSSMVSKSQPPLQQPSSSEEEVSESESEQNVVPLATMSMGEKQKSNVQPTPAEEKNREAVKLPSKRTRASTSKKLEATPSKRPAEEIEPEAAKDGKRSKKKKKVEVAPIETSKKPLFQRLWSQNDEIVILKGIIDYKAEHKCGPNLKMNVFLDKIKGDLHVDANKDQLADKIKKLKRRYENYNGRHLKPLELEAYLLSKAIWGDDNSMLKSRRNIVVKSDVVEVEVASGSVAKKKKSLGKRMGCSCSNVNDKVMSIGAVAFEAEIEIKGSKEWKKLISDEINIQLRKTQLVADLLKR